MNGILVVDKPAGMSSALAVDRVKRAVGAKRAGHGGTLDPIATGVLPVCLGAATKLAQYLLADDKAYVATGRLGVTTDTLDRTGQVVTTREVAVSRDALVAAIAARIGEQDQVPPMFSAIKQGGVRLYRRARAGEHVERAPRRIRIDVLELEAFEPPMFRIAVACSKGTYVRSLIADLGDDVGCGAHLTELRRTRSGRFEIAQAVGLDDLDPAVARAHLIAMSDATGLPRVVVPEDLVARVRSGVQLEAALLGVDHVERFQMVDVSGRMLAVGHAPDGRIIYERVVHDDRDDDADPP